MEVLAKLEKHETYSVKIGMKRLSLELKVEKVFRQSITGSTNVQNTTIENDITFGITKHMFFHY